MRSLIIYVFMAMFWSSHALAIELSSQVEQQHIGVKLTEIDYPPQFVNKELDSGLPNTVSIYLTITKGQELIHAYTVTYQVVYDLWDEVYLLKQITSDGQLGSKQFSDKASLMAYLSVFKQAAFYPLRDLADEQGLILKAQAIVNPVETERIKKIQAWIASSKGFEAKSLDKSKLQVVSNSPTGSVGARASTSSGPRFQKLFDNILEQYINSDELPALWRSKKVSIELLLPSQSSRTN